MAAARETVAALLVRRLAELGVTHIHGVPGDSFPHQPAAACYACHPLALKLPRCCAPRCSQEITASAYVMQSRRTVA